MATEHLIVGGGLAGGLMALALADAGRGAGVTLVDQNQELGGNHTWSFQHADLHADEHALVAEMITATWPNQQVRFPKLSRTLPAGYATISSAQFRRVLTTRLTAAGVRLCLGRAVASVDATSIKWQDGETLAAELVVDARGQTWPGEGTVAAAGGYQKFVGLEVELMQDGPWSTPLLMDATVEQLDGYRFMYVLPFSRRRLLVEDTVYSGNPQLDQGVYRRRVEDYLRRNGVSGARVVRAESGVLPLPTRDPFSGVPAVLDTPRPPLVVGYRGGFYHCVTGYSLPLAARVALAVAGASSTTQARGRVDSLRRQCRRQARFGRLLNELMFNAMPPTARWTAFERFYRLPQETISRFYAGESTWGDHARILTGRPPAGVSWRHLVNSRRKEAHDQ